MTSARVLVCGNNNEGQCGVTGEEGPIHIPKPVTRSVDLEYNMVLSTSSSLRQSFLVTKDSMLLSCGDNDNHELGRSGKKNIFLQIDMLAKFRIREVAAGNGFVHACTIDGRVISWGRNELGQLGDGDRDNKEKPKLNGNFSEAILQFAAGDTHCIALSKSGNVLTFGGNRKGQLGDGQLTSCPVPRVSAHLRHRPVVSISAGANHCMVLTVSGNLYVWGDNTHGQLGLGDNNFRAYPTNNRSLRSAKVCQMSAGGNHSAVVTPQGRLFTFGLNTNGQLGACNPDVKMSTVPLLVEKLQEKFAIQVTCGSAHTLVICSEGETQFKVYSMGLNSNGQCGVGAGGSLHSPVPIVFDEQIEPVGIASGCLSLHSFIFSKDVPLQRASLPRIDIDSIILDCRRLRDGLNPTAALQTLRENVAAAFSSISVLNASFLKREPRSFHQLVFPSHASECLVDLPSVREAYALLLSSDESVVATLGRATLKLTELLRECPYDDAENLNAFLIVLENPLMLKPSHFHVGIERVITGILALPSSYRTILFGWLRSYESEYFSQILNVLESYLSYILTNSYVRTDPYPVTLVLKSLYDCNNADHDKIVPNDSFYNGELEKALDWIKEYELCLSNQKDNITSVFNFCNFPFLLNMPIKHKLIIHDVRKMQFHAMNNYAMAIINKRFPTTVPSFIGMTRLPDGTLDMATLHLALIVNRPTMLYDVLKQIDDLIRGGNSDALQLPLRVSFIGEDAVDYGGVQKELFTLCIEECVKSMRRCGDGNLVWFDDWGPFDYFLTLNNDSDFQDIASLNEQLRATKMSSFYLGVLISLATYNGVLVDLPLPPCVFKFLNGTELSLDDLFDADSSLANGLRAILEYKGDLGPMKELYGVTFTASINPLINTAYTSDNRFEYVDLIEGGSEIYVELANRRQYIELFVKHTLYGCVSHHIDLFVKGLEITQVTDHAMKLCTSKEIEHIICGTRDLGDDDLSILRINTTYKGVYTDEHPVINWLWDVISSLSSNDKRRFLEYVTGSDRLPVGGISNIRLTIQSTEQEPTALPTSHTCFNILQLPHTYESKESLHAKLMVALEHSRGFGFA